MDLEPAPDLDFDRPRLPAQPSARSPAREEGRPRRGNEPSRPEKNWRADRTARISGSDERLGYR